MNTKIVLIVGPSGVGKDTLLKEAKKILDGNFNFLNRYITRKPCKSEDNFYLDEYAFEILKHNSFFVSTWNAHGNYYGIAKKSIKNGINIISISRSKVKDFEKFYDDVYTINISVSKENLRKRLETRGRESKEDIEKRLDRSYQKIESRNLIEFDNSDSLEITSERFVNLLKSIENE